MDVILLVCIALMAYFIFISEAYLRSKIVVLGLFLLSLASYSFSIPYIGLFLQLGINIFIIIYGKQHKWS